MEENQQLYKELQPGTALNAGKYIIEKKIGEGGFGITYRAVQQGLGRTVCIKEYFPAGRCLRNTQARTVRPQGFSDDDYERFRQSFVREAKTLANLHHPNIVEIIDVFDENNTSYMVMPFIEGRSLQSIVEKNGPLSTPDVINFVAQITAAVGYIHQRHILHRDIKPDNIMITAEYKAILIDFGSAREFEEDKTQAHTSMLTRGYAPTEQYTRNSRKGSYTDIYAIGATMYFLLTGKEPLEAAARMSETMQEPKALNPDIPDEVNRTILKAMQIKPENRHQSVQEFMDDLLNVKPSELVDETLGAKTETIVVEKNKKWVMWVIVAAVALIAVLAIWLVKTIVENGKAIAETEDFTGMDIYPMIWVEGGTFTMGNNKENEDDDEGDMPEHTVTLDGFYIGQFEVSQKFWQAIMGYNPSEYQPSESHSGHAFSNDEKGRFPVENVSFDEVQQFITKLNAKTGETFALPTEAQWEYAARGGKIGEEGHPFAGHPDNIRWDSDNARMVDDTVAHSHNKLGIYEMSGNVAEWCLDWYNDSFYINGGSNNPVNTTFSEKGHVVRGGSFEDTKENSVSIFKRYCDDEKSASTGFRLVLKK